MKPKPMDDATFQNMAATRTRDAVAYMEGDIATDRDRATRFYRGDIADVLPDVTGRSKVVSRDLRDTVLAIMPSLMRIFAGSDKAVEFAPVGPEDEEGAEQATDYCNFVLFNDNPGFLILHSAIKDALIRRTGIVKVWWDDSAKITARRYENVDDATYQAHSMDADAEIVDHETSEEDGIGPDGMPAKVAKHSYSVKRTVSKGKVCLEAMPPEELIISRDARSFERPPLIGHKTYKRVGDLVAMGYDYAKMVDLASAESDDLMTEAEESRSPDESGHDNDDSSANDPAMQEVMYVEAYMLVDADGDGILEMRKVCMAGDAYKVLMQEVVDDHPFADFCPEPEPHTAIGLSLYDCLDDIQVIRSQLLRLALDGLAQVVTPRLMVDPNGGVNMASVLDNSIGGVIITKPGGVAPLMTDKAAPQAAMEGYRLMGELRQERTGQNQASMGLKADALQSTSTIAANEVVQQAQSRVEMIARIFAETGMRRMFRLMLSLFTRYQDQVRTIRLRNKWIPMDPRTWNPDMDVTVNVGLGNGNPEERIAFLQQFLQIQQAGMQMMGPQNPLFSVDKIRNTLEDLAEAAGRMPERYLVSKDEWAQVEAQMRAQPPQPPKPSPEEMIAAVERERVQAGIARDNAKQAFEERRELLKDDRERDKNETDIVIRCLEKGINPDAVLAIINNARQATPSVVPGGM